MRTGDGEVIRLFNKEATSTRQGHAPVLVRFRSESQKLKDACKTCWVEGIHSYVFLDLLPAVHLCLQAMTNPNQYEEFGTQWSWDRETITNSGNFRTMDRWVLRPRQRLLTCFNIIINPYNYYVITS